MTKVNYKKKQRLKNVGTTTALTITLATSNVSTLAYAGELETSVMLHYHPELVDMESAGDGSVKPVKVDALNKKIGWMPRNWDEVSEDTGVGNPKKSTAQKGKLFAAAVVERISKLLVDLNDA